MIEVCLSLIFLAIFVEAFTEILVESSILARPREWFARCNGVLGELIHCGYCTSVWVSAAVAWIIPMYIWSIAPWFWVSYFITLFVLHRLSNVFHEFSSKLLSRRPIAFAVHKTETVLIPNIGNDNDTE